MLSPNAYDNSLIRTLQRLRQSPSKAFLTAAAAVGLATYLRWLMSDELAPGLPFITYFPAVVIAALAGGLWSGLLAIITSAGIAWYLFFPPPFSWTGEKTSLITLIVFVAESGGLVWILSLLERAIGRIMAQEKYERALFESSPNGLLVVGEDGHIERANSKAEELFGYEPGTLLGEAVEVLVPQSKAGTHRLERQAYQMNPTTRAMGVGRDLLARRKDGSEFPVEVGLTAAIGRDGAVLATVTDISERKRSEDFQKLVSRELEHQTQNLFTVLLATINNTLTKGRTINEAKELLNGRVLALSRARSMLANGLWQSAPLSDVIAAELEAFPTQITVSGCNIRMNARAVRTLVLVIHELATNATKHGALSAREGHVWVDGTIETLGGAHCFHFTWRERQGPPVKEPTRIGFGSFVLRESPKSLGGQATLNYDPDGFSYELRVPLAAVGPSSEPQEALTTETL